MPSNQAAGAGRPAFKIVLPGAGIVDKDFGSAAVEVMMADGRRLSVTFRTLGNLDRVFAENRRSGARAGGTYLPGSRTVLVEEITKAGIQTAIRDLLETGEFEAAVSGMSPVEEEDTDDLTDPQGIRPAVGPSPALSLQMWRPGTVTTYSPRGGQTDESVRVTRDDVNALVEKHLNDWSTTLSIAGKDQTLTLCFSEGKMAVVVKGEDGRTFTWLSLSNSHITAWFALAGQLTELPERHLVSEFDAIALAEEFVAEWHVPVLDHEWEFRPLLPPPRKSRK